MASQWNRSALVVSPPRLPGLRPPDLSHPPLLALDGCQCLYGWWIYCTLSYRCTINSCRWWKNFNVRRNCKESWRDARKHPRRRTIADRYMLQKYVKVESASRVKSKWAEPGRGPRSLDIRSTLPHAVWIAITRWILRLSPDYSNSISHGTCARTRRAVKPLRWCGPRHRGANTRHPSSDDTAHMLLLWNERF